MFHGKLDNMSIDVTGASDDLIEIDGDISEEISAYDADEKMYYIGFSDGTLLSVKYDDDGIWRINVKQKGEAQVTKTPAEERDDDSDEVNLSGVEIKWFVCGQEHSLNKNL